MSNDKPNSELFNLSVITSQHWTTTLWYVMDRKGNVIIDNIETREQAEALARSVNEHDKLVAELKEARELLKLAWEEITEVYSKTDLPPEFCDDIYNFLNREKK